MLFALAILTLVLGLKSGQDYSSTSSSEGVTQHLVDQEERHEPAASNLDGLHHKNDVDLTQEQQTVELETSSILPPSLDIAPDMRAIAVPVNELTGIGGFLNPGNFVDIIYISTQQDGQRQVTTQQILRNVRVLAFGNTFETQSVQQRAASTAVLEIPATSVAEIVKAVNQGQITLALVGSERDDSEMDELSSLLDDSQCLVLVRENDRNFVSKVPCRLVDESQGRFVRLNE